MNGKFEIFLFVEAEINDLNKRLTVSVKIKLKFLYAPLVQDN